ncbi:type II secretion system F family protein [Planctomycetota bacterium]
MAQAGFYGKSSAAVFISAKMLLMVLGAAVSGVIVAVTEMPLMPKVLVAVAAGSILFFLPNLLVRVLRARRRKQVWRHLPYAIDLMEICVSSGMGLDMAWNVVAKEMRGNDSPLADEMALTNLEIHLGATRLEATRNMAARTGVEEISSFAMMLVQSTRFGTSIADALQTYAASMREERSLQAQELAEKAAVKLIIPMATLLIPALLIIILGPGLMLVVKALE